MIGEWGGFLSGSSAVWLNAFASYLSNKSMTDTFFWCLNPNSGDTGGLLQNVRRGMPDAHPGEIVRRNYSRCLPFSRAYRTGLRLTRASLPFWTRWFHSLASPGAFEGVSSNTAPIMHLGLDLVDPTMFRASVPGIATYRYRLISDGAPFRMHASTAPLAGTASACACTGIGGTDTSSAAVLILSSRYFYRC